MASSQNAGAGNSRRGSGGLRNPYHFTKEQVETLETLFAQFPHPSASQRREMKRMFPVLTTLDDSQLKVWFENHRNATKLWENSDVNIDMEKLVTTNKMVKEENATLVNEVDKLLSENAFLKRKLHGDKF